MNREYGKRYSTSAFAALFPISKHTLFFYDKIGLFSPAGRDKNGYRFYKASQIGVFDTIITLRNIGIPINHIKYYINADSPDKLLPLFVSEKENIDNRIKELTHIKNSISQFTDFLYDFRNKKEGEIEIRYFQKVKISEKENTEGSSEIGDEEWSKLLSSIAADSSKSEMLNTGARILLDDIRNHKCSQVKGIFIKRNNDANSRIEEGLYATIFTYRNYSEFDYVYSALLSEIDKLGYDAVSDAYEEYILQSLSDKNISSPTRIRIMIKKRGISNDNMIKKGYNA